ncbi:MAG: T9SS type A sorting domain-containing protein [Bacteroidetes bacterium]|nr:T9SS type A sorting domain-containing protein [Bacteroidota bacterium]
MKYIFYFSLLAFSFIKTSAQTAHYCADLKKKQFSNRSVSVSLPPGYVPPENKYDLKFYHLNLNVERTTLFISGNVKSLAKVVVPSLDTFAFVLHENHNVDSVYIDGVKCNYVRQDSLVKAGAATAIPQNQLFEAIVYYQGTCTTAGGAAIGNGYNMANSPSWGNQVTWSLSESIVAYHWFPCKQDLRDKIDSSWVYATTDSSNMVGSNGLLKNVVSIGSKKRYEWKSSHPIDYYLISVSTAKYRPYNLYAHPMYLPGDSIFIQNFVYDNAINNTQWATQKAALNKIVPTIELESKLYGMYPFHDEKYGHCMAPLGGGMEHQTMTTLGFFDFEIDAHELGHQWWGDNVTCAAWKDIFINEGWASYTEYLCDQYLSSISGNTAVNKMNTVHNSVMSQVGGSCYFTNADTMNANVIFDSRLTYDKGSAVIHSLRYEINNDSVFFPAIRAFQNTYRASTASVIDFKTFMENYSGLNFTQFFNQWYYGQGYPTFSVSWNQSNNVFYLKSSQAQSVPGSVPLFMTHVDYRISRTAKPDTIVRLFHGQTVENYTLALTGTVTSIGVDPNNWILNKVGTNTHDVTLGGLELSSPETNVFVGPNPTSDALNIYLYNNDKASVEVFDVTGKSVLAQNINAHAEFDISKFANGIYTVTIKNKSGDVIKSTKVVKN